VGSDGKSSSHEAALAKRLDHAAQHSVELLYTKLSSSPYNNPNMTCPEPATDITPAGCRTRLACDLMPTCRVFEDWSELLDDGAEYLLQESGGKVNFRECGTTVYQMSTDDYLKYRPSEIQATVIDGAGRRMTVDPVRNKTSGSVLCGVLEWTQGDYLDDAGFNTQEGAPGGLPLHGVGIEYGNAPHGQLDEFEAGRHIRINFNNITLNQDTGVWEYGEVTRGEGVFVCYNGGSCIGPDTCTCADGWTGYDCATPLCRHLQPSINSWEETNVVGCENGGVCIDKDNCECITSPSKLWEVYEDANRGTTGWMGTDCSMPICTQGFYDPFCTDLAEAPGGEGCYRCSNGGNCTAPDTCTCADGWGGYDCRTPICEHVADALIRTQLNTQDEEKVNQFEKDPCGLAQIYDPEVWRGTSYTRGNCTNKNECTCFCKKGYDPHRCHTRQATANNEHPRFQKDKGNEIDYCMGAWQDDCVGWRNVLDVDEMFGTRDCYDGYEGAVDEYDRYQTCHMIIYAPTDEERYTVTIITIGVTLTAVLSVAYFYIRRKLKQRWLQAKIERRRSRRSSEESITNKGKNAFQS